jgi:hypothetical protein
MPQVPPLVPQAGGAPNEKPPIPLERAAILESLRFTLALLHFGHNTPSTDVLLRTSSSNGWPHSWHWNSNRGISFSK